MIGFSLSAPPTPPRALRGLVEDAPSRDSLQRRSSPPERSPPRLARGPAQHPAEPEIPRRDSASPVPSSFVSRFIIISAGLRSSARLFVTARYFIKRTRQSVADFSVREFAERYARPRSSGLDSSRLRVRPGNFVPSRDPSSVPLTPRFESSLIPPSLTRS